MARKHFDDYYNKICSQLFQLQQTFDDLSKEADNNMISPEQLEQVKKTIQPVRDSYTTLTYIKYLLDMPARKSKQARYDQRSRKVLSKTAGYHKEDVIARNDKIIKGVSL
jgi:hypothetical protein